MEGIESPVPFGVGVVFAAIGVALFVFLLVAFFRDVRAKGQLLEDAPDTSDFDPDVQRYLDRVWLLIAAWKPRVPAADVGELEALWEEAFMSGMRLQESRKVDAETAELVADLTALEEKIEDRIGVLAGL